MPAFFHNRLLMLVLMLGLGLGIASSVYAETKPASAEAVEKLQDRVIELEKETAVLKAELGTRIDAQDNRIADGIGLHGAKVTELSNQTSKLGDLITLVTILAAIAGYFSFSQAKRDAVAVAKIEAKEESEKWFAEKGHELDNKIEQLRVRAQNAHKDIDQQRESIAMAGIEFFKLLEELRAKAEFGQFSVGGVGSPSKLEFPLGNKPRPEWTAADFGAYGYFLFQKGEYEDAFLALEEQIGKLERSAQAEDKLLLATALLNKGDLLVELDRLPEAIATYDAVVQRIDGLSEPGFSERLARAMVHKGVALSKQNRFDLAIKAYDEAVQRIKSLNEPDLRDWVVTALGGKSVLLIQLGRIKQAKDVLVILTEQFNDLEKPNAQQLVKISRVLLRSLGGVSE